jgi:3-hydroxy-9,10-secoandrosta-1,3,5(10)-triene-9,17-dione monooxygenase reductase component
MTTLTPTPEGFVDVMRSLPSGVCVVTAIREQAPAGMTASSVTALSSDPMLVAVTLRPASRTLAAARSAGRFAINLMAARDAHVAQQFAGRRTGEAKYLGVSHRLHAGAPVLDDARAWLVCALDSAQSVGDHVLVIGCVEAMRSTDFLEPPLVTHLGRLTALAA